MEERKLFLVKNANTGIIPWTVLAAHTPPLRLFSDLSAGLPCTDPLLLVWHPRQPRLSEESQICVRGCLAPICSCKDIPFGVLAERLLTGAGYYRLYLSLQRRLLHFLAQ